MYDIVIIGAGVVGSLMADKLSHYDLNVCVLEKNNDSGLEQSMSSSAIVHSGIDPKEGTLKAKLNKDGNKLMKEVCQELNVEFLECGGYLVATNKEEEEVLYEKLALAKQRDIKAEIIDTDSLFKIEPNLNKNITMALSMPTTAVIYPTELTIAAIERAMLNNVDVKYNTKVSDINYDDNFIIKTNNGDIKTKYIINAAGIYSDEIAKMVDSDFNIDIKAKRGEYFVTDNKTPIVSSVIYPTPTKNGKGVLAVPTTHKNVLLGPNGVFQDDKEDDTTHIDDLNYVSSNIIKTLSHMPTDIIKTYTGLRSTGNNGDFYIDYSKNKKMINAVCIDSPGLASSPAIVNMILDMLDIKLDQKKDYISTRTPYLDLKKLDLDEQNKYIKKDRSYGKIVCRCEQITEGEIIDAIHKTNGASDLSGIKFRIRPMLGMCQGGFCEAKVVQILARELGVDVSQITRRGATTLVIKEKVYD